LKPTSRAGQVIAGRYCLEGLLGNGATSNVYLALDALRGQRVVVKELTEDGADNVELRQRFLAEAELLSKVRHPGIVRVLDYGIPAKLPNAPAQRPYLVLEALVGETLAALLARQPLLPIDMALRIARHTALALEAAHRVGIVHRDLKPDNLFLLGPAGDPFGVKIIDFGMAKIPRSNGSSGVHTVLGTVEYMAPEQVMADPVDGRTDIYAFGILMFRLITGHLPFEAPTGLDVLTHQLFSPVPPLSWIADDAHPKLDALVARATRKHPDHRFPDMRAVIHELEHVHARVLADADAIDSSASSRQAFAGSELKARGLTFSTDDYVPTNDLGRKVADLLRNRHGRLTSVPVGKNAGALAALDLDNPDSATRP
jgi:serine/threonine-protein kinase